ncbi:hypothetical protein KTO58_03145 [Chitinophaga pendula]|uniref:DUF6268 family outer membrane beta-barrel protein n=1 Tax=Chitinophaga TaxID=79328 RepID=UPI0012FD49FD|nr:MULTISPECIES: DUF6268 family outer membrane beta-barrel protein [Chitinophaga]UCJ08195.1 hypothetical protein KTO58_03145 [Chitinophaga pendula]
MPDNAPTTSTAIMPRTHRCRTVRYTFTALVTILATSLLYRPSASAQLRPSGMGFSVDYSPGSRYVRPEDSVKTGSTSAMQRFNFEANFLLSNKMDTVTHRYRAWAMTVRGSYSKLTNKDFEKRVLPSELLNADIGVQHLRSLRNNWSLLAVASVGLYTDLSEINSNDLFINAGAFFIKQKGKFTYGFGAVATNVVGVPLLLPGVLFQYHTQGKWQVDVVLPENVSLTYKASKQSDLTLYFRPKQVPYDVDTKLHDKRLLSYWELPIGLEHTWRIGKKVEVRYSGGLMALRSFQYTDKSLSQLFSNAPVHRLTANYFLNAGIRWNF